MASVTAAEQIRKIVSMDDLIESGADGSINSRETDSESIKKPATSNAEAFKEGHRTAVWKGDKPITQIQFQQTCRLRVLEFHAHPASA